MFLVTRDFGAPDNLYFFTHGTVVKHQVITNLCCNSPLPAVFSVFGDGVGGGRGGGWGWGGLG